jgi:hypothetical protein
MVVSVAHTDIPPKEPVVYSKQTQTAQAVNTSNDGEYYFLMSSIFINIIAYTLHSHLNIIFYHYRGVQCKVYLTHVFNLTFFYLHFIT